MTVHSSSQLTASSSAMWITLVLLGTALQEASSFGSWALHHQQRQPSFLRQAAVSITRPTIQVDDEIGHGSYGTVHLCSLRGDDTKRQYVCKRHWTATDLARINSTTTEDRCLHYYTVERHCFEKLKADSEYVSKFVGTHQDDEEREWMVFELVANSDHTLPAPTLQHVLDEDWKDQHEDNDGEEEHHHLYKIQQALNMPEESTFADTLDVLLVGLLKAIAFIHSRNIVHRDLKPSNLLVTPTQQLILIDFGSAADMDPVRGGNFLTGPKCIGMSDRIAISPVYAAPEKFIKLDREPLRFDVYSTGLIFSQLLFNFLDVRTDAAFAQQVVDANWDMDAWLSRELSSKVRPAGLDDALDYLAERPGLWGMLCKMMRRNPRERISSQEALVFFQDHVGSRGHNDSPFLESVLNLREVCDIPPLTYVAPRPLHFVASFKRQDSLGLILAEADQEVTLEEGEELQKWQDATMLAEPGDVFVQGVTPNGQADAMETFEVGDKLQKVGELGVGGRGFEKVVAMLGQQPKSAKYVKLQFERVSVSNQVQQGGAAAAGEAAIASGFPSIRIADQGAWSATGKRKANEDVFVLYDVHPDDTDETILLAGVFDGHAGKAASKSASKLMPFLLTDELTETREVTTRQALEEAWKITCEAYQNGCDEMGECIAEYDAIEGILLASTGSQDVLAGTTASMAALKQNELTILNCGDSRTLVINDCGKITFETVDHTPQNEMERLRKGIEEGLDYSMPQCSLSKYWLNVGDMQYSVGRSLEGPFATSKGIVSDAEMTSLSASPGILLIASDGLWEVCGSAEIGREVTKLRKEGVEATEAAKRITALAIEKGTYDNVSVVLVYLEEV